MRFALPDGLAFDSLLAPRGWTCVDSRGRTGGDVRCVAEALRPGEDVTLEVRGTVVPGAGALHGIASAVSNALDRQPADNEVATANPVLGPEDAPGR